MSFADAAAAERRVAGMSAAGRWVATARAAGGCDPVFMVGGTTCGWTAATLGDAGRTGDARIEAQVPAAAIGTFLDAQPRGLLLLASGRYLPDARTLGALLAFPRGALAPDGAPAIAPGTTRAPLPPFAGADFAGVDFVVPSIDLADPAAAVRRLVRDAAKPSDGVVSRRLNRPISQRISAQLLLRVPGIRPSHMTLVVAVTAAAMVAALLFGGWTGLIAGGVLFHVASVLDGVDGEIARATCRSSVAGAILDTRVDVATNLGFFVGIAVSLTRFYGAWQAVVGGIGLLFGMVGMVLLGWLARRAGRPGSLDVLKHYYRDRFPTGWRRHVTEMLVAMTSRDCFAFAFGVLIVVGEGWTVSWLLATFGAIWLVTIVGAFPGLLRAGDAPVPVEALAVTD